MIYLLRGFSITAKPFFFEIFSHARLYVRVDDDDEFSFYFFSFISFFCFFSFFLSFFLFLFFLFCDSFFIAMRYVCDTFAILLR